MERDDLDNDVPAPNQARKEHKRREEAETDKLLAQLKDIESLPNPDDAVRQYSELISKDDPKGERSKLKEQAIYSLGKLLAKLGRAKELKQLLVNIRPFFNSIPKGKTAKIVRSLIDLVGEIPDSLMFQAELCKESIEWCIQEKRTFLKQRIQARLANLYLKLNDFKDALKLINKLVKEVKKIDDKLLMVEIELIASRVHHSLQNIPAAKGSLTSARSAANSIYCPPLLQAEIDLQAGTICGEEKDFKTAFSYFYEAFEGYNTVNNPQEAIRAMKYMLLSKIMTNTPSDVYAIINGKVGVKFAGVDMEAMKAIADASRDRSLAQFEKVIQKYRAQLQEDYIVARHLNDLYDNLLQQNLLRIIEPFSRVQIPHVAHLIKLPVRQVEDKLSEMILDNKLNGTLDQGSGDLIIFDDVPTDKTFQTSSEIIQEMGSVMDKLYVKASQLRRSL